MKTGFKVPNPIPKEKQLKSPWNFDCPPYDERSSCFVNAGTHYGKGINQPVGHKQPPKFPVDALPQNKVDALKVAEVPYENKELDIGK